MKLKRSAGILCHITSLPGRYGTGTLGQEAYDFIDLVAGGGFSYIQILPVGPVSPSMGWSPYSSVSAFAGNELFISPDIMASEKWSRTATEPVTLKESHKADFFSARDHLRRCIINSFHDFVLYADGSDSLAFSRFCDDHNESWLDDYALFTAISHDYRSYNWMSWDRDIALRENDALNSWRIKLSDRILIIKYAQFMFYRQWNNFKEYANGRGIGIIGDIPIYVSNDSADAWSNREILTIDPEIPAPEYVAGVPPDYFSKTGQLWGNPLYRWRDSSGRLRDDTFNWWSKRISRAISLCDIIRIDHFRGFDAFWSVKYGEETAVNGKWVNGPGQELFNRLKDDLGDLPLIAEDLGIITRRVKKLRDGMELPGMKILQFAFDGGPDNEYLPHNIKTENCVLYTGTHDNDTTNGWFYDPDMPIEKRDYIMAYMGMNDWSDFHWRMIREAYASQAALAVIPVQDITGFGREFRMNTPGTTEGNWTWKLIKGELTVNQMDKLRRMAEIFSRIPAGTPDDPGEDEIEIADEF